VRAFSAKSTKHPLLNILLWNQNLFNRLGILWQTCWYVYVVRKICLKKNGDDLGKLLSLQKCIKWGWCIIKGWMTVVFKFLGPPWDFYKIFIVNDYVICMRKWFYKMTVLQRLPKSSIAHGLNLRPPRKHHHMIFTTLPVAYASIPVRLRSSLTSSCKDLSRLWNRLFYSQGPIPVWMAPSLMAVFLRISVRNRDSPQGDFRRSYCN